MDSKNSKITQYKAACREYINNNGCDAHLRIVINSIYGKFSYEQRIYQNNPTIKRRISEK